MDMQHFFTDYGAAFFAEVMSALLFITPARDCCNYPNRGVLDLIITECLCL